MYFYLVPISYTSLSRRLLFTERADFDVYTWANDLYCIMLDNLDGFMLYTIC